MNNEWIVFIKNQNLFGWNTKTGITLQLTNITRDAETAATAAFSGGKVNGGGGFNGVAVVLIPTCKGNYGIRNMGLNYVFKNSIIGFSNKIELSDVLRGKLRKVDKTINVTDVIQSIGVDKTTGKITWP